MSSPTNLFIGAPEMRDSKADERTARWLNARRSYLNQMLQLLKPVTAPKDRNIPSHRSQPIVAAGKVCICFNSCGVGCATPPIGFCFVHMPIGSDIFNENYLGEVRGLRKDIESLQKTFERLSIYSTRNTRACFVLAMQSASSAAC